ncbi:DUF3307 domain-containing protein [Amaricoccus sp.]|uniref:DUF3307 domain-containing protein n=1 Tax=Amaricoccus sp. TaxID=1872485 RepID=UPI001B7A83AD|nr:DUF3307 domain-containing protein [Amaricoccus sp.]MBP7240392.1 DUF3307 domain-containing protein [Amaricoccus sp.]
MLETAVALVLGHLVADFLLQSDRMARTKARPASLAAHLGVVAAASWIALGMPPAPLPILAVVITHGLTDMAKARLAPRGFAGFSLDQAAHLAAIWIVASLWPGTWAQGLWAQPFLIERLPGLARLPEAMALGAGLVCAVWAGGYAVRELMHGLKDFPDDPEKDMSLPNGGQMIGRLERLMILMLLVADQPDGIGLLIAAKSILRFNELAKDASDRRASEYVIIGTLASFAWAIGVGFVTQAATHALAP